MVAAVQTSWREQHFPEIVGTLVRRPGHELVRTLVADTLRYGFGVAYHEIDHEVRLPEVHGRADTLFGLVVFEFKRDLRQELPDVEARLPDYLAERERQTRRHFLGIATDGATFIAYELREAALLRSAAMSRTRRGRRRCCTGSTRRSPAATSLTPIL